MMIKKVLWRVTEGLEKGRHYDPNTVISYWEVGKIFDSVDAFRKAVSKYDVLRRVDLTIRPNEPKRVRVKC